eukprot:TRINITY_DN16230_c0_g1_i4.p2 TRINITY_DN16230_c0_g1~~TRINITY_DN16230_c0_g1_i4.p2  ORF type:complete len:163 (+),score=27.22 TRINITY_DN16230_c0_g1_i4:53-490(+)
MSQNDTAKTIPPHVHPNSGCVHVAEEVAGRDVQYVVHVVHVGKKANLPIISKIFKRSELIPGGFDNVHDQLVHMETGESAEEIKARKLKFPWGAFLTYVHDNADNSQDIQNNNNNNDIINNDNSLENSGENLVGNSVVRQSVSRG